jgi:hypothetical protein
MVASHRVDPRAALDVPLDQRVEESNGLFLLSEA